MVTRALLLALLATASPAHAGKPTPLVVLVVIDQFRADYLTRYADLFDRARGAFTRFERDGAFFTQAYYEHAATITGPGHAHIATGVFGDRNGMAGNRWYDRAGRAVLDTVSDPEHPLVGGSGAGCSPRRLLADTVGDAIGDGQVVALATKARAAVLLGGHRGRAYWLDEASGRFVTSTYYAMELPFYMASWNDRRVIDGFFGAQWKPSVDERVLAARASADDALGEGDVLGLGRSFPHVVTGGLVAPGEAFFDAVTRTPFGNDLVLDLARAVVEGEGLGRDGHPDLLAVSLSANDEIGHLFGPYSREVLDATVRTDRQLGDFMRWVELRVPGVVFALTADHGAGPIPEQLAALGIPATRIKKAALIEAADGALDRRYGEGDWVLAAEEPNLYLDRALAAARGVEPEALERTAAEGVGRVRGVARCYTRSELMRGAPPTPHARAYQRGFHGERSGDLVVAPAPYSFWGSYGEKDYGDAHGAPYSFDNHVPLAFAGAGITKAIVHDRVSIADLAPTLASLLGIRAPSGAEGRVLPVR